ncbi:MAG: hypothetical protein C4B59_09100 [Candidatus Methanogaster sp.]|uniref:Uncharacterized protein n=1 Tax=Candidatus Methanogaster sp. TaxID=3386292 RepID=A0AC61L2T2_9EURY|nr:MAG: hypothetical protein C4B59_09100 [ANME-2 cluster archaeon]
MDSRRICVDSDVVIDYLRGKTQFQDVLPSAIEKYDCYIAPISAYELYYGGYYSGRADKVDDVLNLFGILDCPRASIRKSAEIHVRLSKTGNSLDIKDILVAGTCIYFNLPLLTRNIKHFCRIKELSLVDVDALL